MGLVFGTLPMEGLSVSKPPPPPRVNEGGELPFSLRKRGAGVARSKLETGVIC